jgi:hypothetical protein
MPIRRRSTKGSATRFALFPLAMTLIVVLGMAALAILGADGAALCLGVAAGGLLFLRGAVVGGRLGNARQVGQTRADVSMQMGACLALAGIAAGAQGHDPPFAWPERTLIGLGQGLASLLAVGLAGRQAKQARPAKETKAAEHSAAKPL